MAYNTKLADKVRKYLFNLPDMKVEEKKMFGGLAFLINGKMCVNVTGEKLMCRFDPNLQKEISQRKGYKAMIMRGKKLQGYCYVHPDGIKKENDFKYWMNLCLTFNKQAKSSKKM